MVTYVTAQEACDQAAAYLRKIGVKCSNFILKERPSRVHGRGGRRGRGKASGRGTGGRSGK